MRLTAIIITYNEEEMIGACLKSVSWTDEKIVIDTSSSDRTRSIAQKMGAKVYETQFENFSKLRELGLQKAQGEWLLYIDADERLTTQFATQFRSTIIDTKFSAFSLTRKNFYLGHPWPYSEKVVRLFKKNKLIGWFGDIHESPKVNGRIGKLDQYIYHYTHRDIASMVEKTNKWSEIEADLRLKANHPNMTSWRFIRIMATSFWEYFIKQQGYKAGTVGIIESIYQSFSSFITYAKLWERQQQKS